MQTATHGDLGIGGQPPPPEWPRRRRRRPRRLVLVVSVVVVLAGAGVGTWLAVRSGSSPTSPVSVSNKVVAVTTGTIRQTVAASGTIEPDAQASLGFAVSGTVTAVDVAAGQKVHKGEVLAKVNPSALKDDEAAAEASLASARARLSTDKAAGAATSQIDSDEAAVTSAGTQLSTAKTDLADAELRSTLSGTVASVGLAVGDQVSGSGGNGSGGSGAGGTGSAGTAGSGAGSASGATIEVVGTSGYAVSTSVGDADIGKLKVGDQAQIVPEGSSKTVYGLVSSIGLIASNSSGVTSFPVGVEVTGDPPGLYAGTSATVTIIVKQIDNAIEVPTAAISYTSAGKATVTRIEGGRHVTTDVTTGQTSGGDTQITSGLASGDRVLERVVSFNHRSGSGHSLFGNRGGAFPGGGSFPGRGSFPGGGRFPGGGSSSPGGGGGGGGGG